MLWSLHLSLALRALIAAVPFFSWVATLAAPFIFQTFLEHIPKKVWNKKF